MQNKNQIKLCRIIIAEEHIKWKMGHMKEQPFKRKNKSNKALEMLSSNQNMSYRKLRG